MFPVPLIDSREGWDQHYQLIIVVNVNTTNKGKTKVLLNENLTWGKASFDARQMFDKGDIKAFDPAKGHGVFGSEKSGLYIS